MNNIDLIKNNLNFLYYNDIFEQEECHDILDDLTDVQNDMESNLECSSIRMPLFRAISNLNKISEIYKHTLNDDVCYNYIDNFNGKYDIVVSSEDFKTNRKKAIYNLEKVLFFIDLKYGNFTFWRKNKNFKNKSKELAKF